MSDVTVEPPPAVDLPEVDLPEIAEPEVEAPPVEPPAAPAPQEPDPVAPIVQPEGALPPDALLDVPLRLTAELGRVRMPLAQAVALPPGALVELDHEPDDPIAVFLDGIPFGTARLLVVDEGWVVRLETINGFGQASSHAEAA